MNTYVYATVLTNGDIASNNCGENEGNIKTLQKIVFRGVEFSTVSSEAIKFAIRNYWQINSYNTNRLFDEKNLYTYVQDKTYEKFEKGLYEFIDDDLSGYMYAAQAENDEEEPENDEEESKASKPKGKGSKKSTAKVSRRTRGIVRQRRAPFVMGPALSLHPYSGDSLFKCASNEKKEGNLTVYSTEVHGTEYQYSFGLNVDAVVVRKHIEPLFNAIIDMPPVAGNHARFFYDFSPETIVFRVTNECAPRINKCFELDDNNEIKLSKLIRKIACGDVPAKELIVGGIFDANQIEELKKLGVMCFEGVRQAKDEVMKRISS